MQLDIVASVFVCGFVAYATLRYSGIGAARVIAGLAVAAVAIAGLALFLVHANGLGPGDVIAVRNTVVGSIVGLVAGTMMARKRARDPE